MFHILHKAQFREKLSHDYHSGFQILDSCAIVGTEALKRIGTQV